ncbi:prepilin peptidase [Fusibacter sp. JL216-2]|uniref:prepilin peptidase n=1 Tax=Fusibacter sp. JL216-2 TaxID=3071453 RepID=UPI003D3265BF
MQYTAAVLGLLIGSFLNVIIYRLPKNESIAFPGSHCYACGHDLKAIDNIPLLSYVFLKGKCRYCKAGISMQYPIIELITGVIFGLLYLRTGLSWQFLFEAGLVSALICVTVIDLKHEIIPDSLNLFIGLLGVGYLISSHHIGNLDALYGFLAGGLVLFLIALVGPMGGGDIKYMAAMGLWLGLFPTIAALLIAFIMGGLIGVLLIALRIKNRKDHIPFGPFLVFGSIVGYFFFEEFVHLYFRLLL